MKSISRQWISEGYLASLIKKDNLISKKKSENNHRLCDFWSCEENQNLIAYNYFKPILE